MSSHGTDQVNMTIDLEAVLAKAKTLFPEFTQLGEIEKKIQKLEWERANLVDRKLGSTNAFNLKVVETNQLRCIILDFEKEQTGRVKVILHHQQPALDRVEAARRAKVKNTVLNGMPLIEEHAFMRWETDTDSGDGVESSNKYDLIILQGEEELQEFRERMNYERMLHESLVKVMEMFVHGARLATHERTLWSAKENDSRREIFQEMTTAEFVELKNEAFAWMKAATIHFLEIEQQTGRVAKVPSKSDADDMATTSPISGHDEITGSYSKDTTVNAWEKPIAPKQNYCYFCQKYGHTNEYCPEMFPEEDAPNFCDVCDKEGHTEEGCWVLHPELKAAYLAEQAKKQQRMKCHQCGATGHVRRWCHRVHG